MKTLRVLYAIQGTGNGHISRAREIIPYLEERCLLEILVSGTQAEVKLNQIINYKLKGLSFIFGKRGGVDLGRTYFRASMFRLYKEIKQLPVDKYDLIINDFEPVSAWAGHFGNVPVISLSHQAAVLDDNAPQPLLNDNFAKFILKNYAPANHTFGFHFQPYANNIFTPVINQEIRDLEPSDKGHYTVYLPAYSDQKLIEIFSNFKQVRWEIFSKHNKKNFMSGNISIQPVNREKFICSLKNCTGVLCGAGFETPAEALFLGKKLMVIPMKFQYEQQCNAAALKTMDVDGIPFMGNEYLETIGKWIENGKIIRVNYPDITEYVLDKVFEFYYSGKVLEPILAKNK
jgi:uncharacterized protein (TIGR00661 family)